MVERAEEVQTRILIVGTGFSGLGAAIRLLESGEQDVLLIERAGDVGGCWRDNRYPGLQCDVQSVVYSFSFAPNPDWSRAFPWGTEIHAYLRQIAEQYDLMRRIRFHTELQQATWDEASQVWRVETSQGPIVAEILLSAHGALSEPAIPSIPGLDAFEGPVVHSARWPEDLDLSGKRVAVIGTGASAIQIVPAIVDQVESLTVYQRSAAWVLPRPDGPVPETRKWLYRTLPITQKIARAARFATLELRMLGMTRPGIQRVAEAGGRLHLRAQVRDPELRARLTPDYRMGCKRVLLSNEYYPALCREKTEVVTDGIARVGPTWVQTGDGERREVDVIVLCTGFHVAAHPLTRKIAGVGGRTLAEHWEEEGARALLGMTVSGFPNLFLIATGPHTGLGHNSIVFMIESQLAYLDQALAEQRRRGGAVMEVRPEVVRQHSDAVRAQLEGAVWSSGCSSYYLDDNGQNIAIWPGFAAGYWRATRRFEPTAYRYTERVAAEVRHAAA